MSASWDGEESDARTRVVLSLTELGRASSRAIEAVARLRIVSNLESIDGDIAADTVGLIVRSGVELDGVALSRFPALRFVLRAGSGVDNIDIDWLRERGLYFARNPLASAAAVSEIGLACLVLLTRQVALAHNTLSLGEPFSKEDHVGEPLSGLTVAVWGRGPVGQACRDVFTPLVAEVVVVTSSLRGAGYVTPRVALSRADVHVLARPPGRSGPLVDSAWVAAASHRRPYVVNLARADIVDAPSLEEGLRTGALRGAAVEPIDASDREVYGRILRRGPALNLLCSGHLGAQRADVRLALDLWLARQVRDLMAAS